MNETKSDVAPNAHLGFRIAVGVAGLALIALFVMLGSVAMKQSATTRALETHESLREAPPPDAPVPVQPRENP
ncbi:MAG: hypothetical protein Q8O79_05820 [Pseudomonadota bacterium]|nr:hypothetical protein [Pseudomonadota bacterium]